MRHSYRCPLRWSDMDAFGHVNNAVYLRYLEEARIDFLAGVARRAAPEAFTGGTVVARHEIDYLRPLVHQPDPVVVELWVTKLSAASVTFAYEVKDTEGAAGPYVRASTVVVPYDFDEQYPRRLTAAERSFLEGYFDDSQHG
ncbi:MULTISPECIES: acyl-CoA thioesterase [Streptomyces]|uniref:Thioesterase n=1 Tax=Streptomyces cacaoi TaxID=1898 RepID=A0A4Y3R0F6_STRCI|nr:MULTISPECIES: thioesterase family protein [Streptomyces]NNG84158.1 acyl-CoA thioesterase [Streptomyces cacaoi]QHF93461.1 acyl-CoA thioesterase [Streptomyces sp. NHF165]GEB50962.1 thioesterase [Streptomyces cacaoi]